MSEEGEKAPSGGGGDAEVTKNEGDAQAGEAEANEEEKKEEEVKEEEKKEEEKKEEDVKEEEKAKEEEKKDEETKEEEKKEEEVKEEAKEEEKKEEEAKEEKKEEEVKDEEKKEEEAKEEEKKDEVKEEIKEEEKKEEEAKEEEKKEEAKEEAKEEEKKEKAKEEEKKEESKEEEKKEESKEEEKKEEVKQEAKEEEKKEEDKKDEGKKEDESKEGESQEVTNEQNEEEKKEDTKTESEEKKAEGESAEKREGEQEDASKKGEAESDEKKVPETDGKKDEDGEAKPEKAAEESEPKGAEDQQEVKERASPETDENKATSDKERQAQEQQTESAVEPATQTEKGEAGAEEKKKSSSSSSSSSDSKKEKSDHQKEETQEEKASEGPEKTEEKKQTATSDKEQDTQETAQNEPMTDTGGIEVKDVEIPSPTQERKPPEQNEETAKPPADSASTTEVDVHSENETKPESPGTFMVTKVDEPHIAQEESQDNGGSETRYRDDEEEMLRAVDAFNCGCSQSRKLNPNLPKATKRRKKPQNEYGASWLSPSGRPQSRAAPEGTTSPSTTYGGQQSRNRTSLGRRPISDEWKTQTYPRTSPTRTSPTRTVVKPVRKAPQKRALEPMQTSPPKEKPEPKPEPKAKEEPQKQSGNLTDDLSDSANLESSDSSEAPKALKEQEKTKSNEDKEDIQKADIPVYDEKGDHIKFGDSRARKRQNARSATAKPKRESDDQIDRILRYDLPPPSEQEAVLKQIRKDELHSIIDEEYESARRLQTAETILMTRPIRTREVNSYYTTNQSRLDQARNTYAQKEADWQRRMDDFDAQAEENMKKLIESQQEELKNFEEYWQDDKAMIPYTKASSSLISMRQHQKVCALTKDYDAALAVQNSADERQLYEEMNAEQKAAAAMLAAREQLLAKHQQQRECTASHSQRLRQRLEAERDKNLSETERVIQNRENNLNEQYEVRARVNQQTRTIVQSRGYNSMQVSPRTRRSLIDYRSRTTQTKLRVSGTNVTQKLHPSPNRSPPRPFTPGTTKKYGGYK